jgi:hypothetical protein
LGLEWNVAVSETYELGHQKSKLSPAENSWILCGATVEFSRIAWAFSVGARYVFERARSAIGPIPFGEAPPLCSVWPLFSSNN